MQAGGENDKAHEAPGDRCSTAAPSRGNKIFSTGPGSEPEANLDANRAPTGGAPAMGGVNTAEANGPTASREAEGRTDTGRGRLCATRRLNGA